MTDQLMDDLSNEEHEALLLMSEHAIASPLSPAAKAVAWAYDNAPEKTTGNHRYHWIAAALRAAALYCTRERRILMTIADELEGIS